MAQVPEHVRLLQSSISELKRHAREQYKQRIESDEFKATVPSQRLQGRAYVASKGSKTATAPKLRTAASSLNVDTIHKPLLHMFYFNRIIVDEFHQNDPKENAVIASLHADKRWGLSGTPAMADFLDLSQLTSLLGVPARIGSDARGLMKTRNIERIRKEMTEFERFDAMRETPSSSVNSRIHEIYQLFLDRFVRQNVMDFGALDCQEMLMPVTLDIDHRAIYTELSEHLNSLDMRMKRGKKAEATDREERLHQAVATSASAEEALSKTAAYLERNVDGLVEEGSGLSSAIATRENEVNALKGRFYNAVLDARSGEPESLAGWVGNKISNRSVGDDETVSAMKEIIDAPAIGTSGKLKSTSTKAKAKSKRESRVGEEDEDEDQDETAKAGGKNALTSVVNKLCSRLVVAHRSLRFLRNVQKLQMHALHPSSHEKHCEAVHCHSTPNRRDDIAVSAVCGHIMCKGCFDQLDSVHGARCPAAGCGCFVKHHHLLWKSKMGDLKQTSHAAYGAKLEAAMELLEGIDAKHEKAILFVQYPEQLAEAERALAARQISATVVKDTQRSGKQIQAFREGDGSTVLVLNASDETAAGSNLQVANHVIFLSPLLRDSQYDYDATKAQAIGRVRRHGQKKRISVYWLVALDTIDVDILEHRERRTDALTEEDAPAVEAPPVVGMLDMHEEPKRERTQLVKEDGRYSLRPHSWLVRCGADQDPEEVAKVKGKSRVLGWEDFSSLVKFSKAYTEDDD